MGGTRQPPVISSVQDGMQSLKTFSSNGPMPRGCCLGKMLNHSSCTDLGKQPW